MSSRTHPAPVGKRVGAFIIDVLLLVVVMTMVVFATPLLPATPEGVTVSQSLAITAVQAAFYLVYFVATEALTGQTLAKRLLGIKVEMVDGSKVTFIAALVRRLPLVAGGVVPIFGPVINFSALLAAMVTAIQDEPDNRGYHDRWAKTRVVDLRAAPTP